MYPEKFPAVDEIFARIHPGARIFIGTACGEPQALTRALAGYVQTHPGSLFDAELIQVWTQGITPYAEGKFPENFRLNSFFVGESTRTAVNSARADYTPIFLSSVPDLIYKEMMPLDLAIVQTTLPDEKGNVSLGISVDIVRAAVDKATLVAAQANSRMPFVSGDGIINLRDLDFIVPWDEPLLWRTSLRLRRDHCKNRSSCGPHHPGRVHAAGGLREHARRRAIPPGGQETPRRAHRATQRPAWWS